MILHVLDGRGPGDSYGDGYGNGHNSGYGNGHNSGNGRGCGSGLNNGTGYGGGDDVSYTYDADNTVEVVAPCVSQMYLLAQVLEDP